MIGDRIFNIDIDVYDATIRVIITNDMPKVCEQENFDDIYDGQGLVHYDRTETCKYMFYIVLLPNVDLGVIVHESAHAANRVLHSRGVQTTYLEDEAMAYLTEYIFKELIKKLQETEFKFVI